MRSTVTVLVLIVAMLATVGFASSDVLTAVPVSGPVPASAGGLSANGTTSIDTRPAMCRPGDYKVMVCHGESLVLAATAESLRLRLLDLGAGKFAAVDTYCISNGGHAVFPATDWYDQGYRAILVFTDWSPEDSAALGDSLARFIELGGGVVEGLFADQDRWGIRGDWRSTYAPFTPRSNHDGTDSLGEVHQSLHPVMAQVYLVSVGDWKTGNTASTLRSPNCAALAEFRHDSACFAACFDSAGRRAVSLGLFPLSYWQSPDSASGQWCELLVNALNWVAVGPSVGVSSPNGGETWGIGSVHNITWSQTDNVVNDSIYYSTDGGSNWTAVVSLPTPPDPLEYAWTVPSTPTTQARVKVVAWDQNEGRVEDISNADFTIATVGIAQGEDKTLPCGFALYQPCPNPLVTGTQLRYALPRPAQVELRTYDVAGALVRRLTGEAQAAGLRRAYWDGCDDHGRRVAPGVYYCRLKADDFSATQKLVVRR